MGKKIGCLLIHGFGGNVGEVAPLAEYLSERDFRTVYPPLKGHTGKRRDMARAGYTDWIESAEEAFLQLNMQCEKVVLIGFSMGGLIALNLAKKYKAAAVITLNTPIYHWDFKRIGLNLLEDFKQGEFKYLKRYVKAIFANPLIALINFKRILTRTKLILKDITCPMLIAQGLKDDTAYFRSADYLYTHIGSEIKEVKYYMNSEHPICLGKDCETLFGDVLNFIESKLMNV